MFHQFGNHTRRILALIQRLHNRGMFRRERHKPIAERVEERKALQLRESTEVDVGASLLHILHLANRCLEFFHRLVLSIGMQDVFHRVVLLHLDATTCHAESLILHQSRHDVTLNSILVLLCIQTIHHLHLQLEQLLAGGIVAGEPRSHFLVLGKEIRYIPGHREGQRYESTLAKRLFCGLLIDTQQRSELMIIGFYQTIQQQGSNKCACIVDIDGWREQQRGVEFLVATRPLRGDDKRRKQ